MRKIVICFGVLLLALSELVAGECGYIGIEYLYWNLAQVNMPYAVSVENITELSNFSEIRQEDHWASGFRLSLGATLCCCIEGRAAWTRFHNEFTDSFSKESMLASELLAPNLGFIVGGGDIGGPASSKWRFEYDLVDIDFGTWICLTDTFNFFPYIGVKGGVINQMQCITYENFLNTNSGNRIDALVEEKSDIWAVGPRLGFESEFRLFPCWSLSSDLGVAILFGHQISPAITRIDEVGAASYSSDFHTDKWRGIPCFNIRLGVDWSTQICGCYKTLFGIAYEAQHFWDLWRTQNSIIQQIYITDASFGPLTMQGFTVKAVFGF